MIQEIFYPEIENLERYFSKPPIIVKENQRSSLVDYAGIVPVWNLIQRLVQYRLDAGRKHLGTEMA